MASLKSTGIAGLWRASFRKWVFRALFYSVIRGLMARKPVKTANSCDFRNSGNGVPLQNGFRQAAAAGYGCLARLARPTRIVGPVLRQTVRKIPKIGCNVRKRRDWRGELLDRMHAQGSGNY